MAFLGFPDPAIKRLMGDPWLVELLPGGRYEFRAEFFLCQPGSGLLFQVFGKPDFLSLQAVSFPGPIDSHLCQIVFRMEAPFTGISLELPANGTFMNPDEGGDFGLGVAFFV